MARNINFQYKESTPMKEVVLDAITALLLVVFFVLIGFGSMSFPIAVGCIITTVVLFLVLRHINRGQVTVEPDSD